MAAHPTAPPYTPALALCRGSVLTASQLVSDFQDFYANLEYISCAPALVFERLVASLNELFTTALQRERLEHATTLGRERLEHATALERERLQYATALDRERLQNATALSTCNGEKKTLQLSNDQLRKELAELKATSNQGNSSAPIVKLKPVENPTIRTFSTQEVRSAVQEKTSRQILFANAYSAPPGVVVGFNLLSIRGSSNIRVKAYASNIKNDCFNINIDSWSDTRIWRATCSLLEVAPGDPDFQFGVFDTKEDHPISKRQSATTRLVTFPHPYKSPPKVVVWLTELDMDHEKNWRIKAYADYVTPTSFTLHVDTWGDSLLYFATASWVAYTAGRPNVSSGKFNTTDMRQSNCPQLYNSAYINFGKNMFTAPPNVLLAINSLDVCCQKDMRLEVKASSVSATGMAWHINHWDNSILYSAGASYIALS